MSDFTRRIHVVPFGPETDRITKPAIEMRADLVVLVSYLGQRENVFAHLQDEVEATLNEVRIETERVEYDVGNDLYAGTRAIAEQIARFQGDEVNVNLSAGGKVMALAGMIAAMTSPSARPYYVQADDAASVRPTPATNVRESQSIPRFPMDHPPVEQLAVMKFIDAGKPNESAEGQPDYEGEGQPYRTKSACVEYAQNAGLRFMTEGTQSSGAMANRLNAHIVDPGVERGDLLDVKVGTHRRVVLTEQGQNMLTAFDFLLPESVIEPIDNSSD